MVTFGTDHWTPALDVHVKPKMSPPESRPRTFFGRDKAKSTKHSVFGDSKNRPRSSSTSTDSSETSTNVSKSSPKSPQKPPNQPRLSVDTQITAPPTPPESIISENIDPLKVNSAGIHHEKKNVLRMLSPKLSLKSPDGRKNGGDKPNLYGREDGALVKRYGTCQKGYIGKGASAVVRLAQKIDITSSEEKLYAIKEFRKRRKHETEKDYMRKLTSEFCISSTLRHPNIVETVDLVQDEHHNWCEVMEFMNGGDLYNAIKSGHMSSLEIDCCFKQLISGVAYLHSMGVAHRDIKPENLLLDNKGHLKITDFGVSDVFRMCWESKPHLSEGLCGSEPYIAPEQFEEKRYDARKVDIWSCGIVYYSMVYQGIPFRIATEDDFNYQNYLAGRSTVSYQPFERLPKGARELIYRILDPNPETRCTIEDILEDEWFKSIEVCQNGKGVERDHVHVLNTTPSPTKKKPLKF